MADSPASSSGSSLHTRATDALAKYAGVGPERATALIEAIGAVAASEALEVVTGEATVYGSLTDTRVERLRRIVVHLAGQTNAAAVQPPNSYELASLWRITENQARTVLRTWRARHPELYEDRMAVAASQGSVEAGGGERDRKTWVVSYDDPDVLAYAENRARRAGLSKGLKVDRSALTLEAPQSSKSHADQDLKQVLGVK